MGLKIRLLGLAFAVSVGFTALARGESPPPAGLQNGGFEEDLAGWEARGWRPFDQTSSAAADTQHAHEGAKSCRIENLAANDSLAEQTVAVEPDTTYEISAWIRTENVASEEGPEGANLSLEGTRVHTESIKGTRDWQRSTLWVKTESDQTTLTVQCRLGYFGSISTGRAWFDGVTIEKTASPPAEATVQSLTRPPGSSNRPYWLTLAALAGAIGLLWTALTRVESRHKR